MDNLETIRAILYSRNIDSNNVKPYSGLHLSSSGDLILSTPSLESYRVNNDPMHRYMGNLSSQSSGDVDQRLLSYDTLENRRYQSLKVKQPAPHNVTRILHERFGSAISPRSDPSRTIRMSSGPGYRVLTENVPNQEQTMVSQRFNKLSPFVTEHGNNPNAHPFLRQSLA